MSALLLALALLDRAAPAWAQQEDEVTAARIDGANRLHTAANISAATFEQADIVHVVTGQDFPDALAASYGAGVVAGPILLVTEGTVPQATWDELGRLGAERVVIIGGEGAVSEQVQEELEERGYDVVPVADQRRRPLRDRRIGGIYLRA